MKLYTDSTPNGIKVSMALEELGLPYDVEHIDISSRRQKEPWFLEINPNGRIPAIVDTLEDGKQIRIFEGESILQYLTERYDCEYKLSFPPGTAEYWECKSWLFFQHGGIGPMQGQAAHFLRYAPTKIPYAIDRYVTETKRLYKVLDTQLEKSISGFLVGDHVSIADVAALSWVIYGKYVEVDMDDFPSLKRWESMMSERPGIQRGFHVPKPLAVKSNDPKALEAYAQHNTTWILEGMEQDRRALGKRGL
ncbi:Glutathione S-transferase 2 [Knufia peltigerae]|uniref:Glutathione S-transferase 2 n=1 Tax=Knufia peltigerae TaxID=1002370 RepID=A0AA38Y2I4_9EURO|nr:Glutathione S-transferase 2 [Knufia peltigerae]